jgi:hypothetical protein
MDVARVEGGETLAHAVDRVGVPTGGPVLVVVGGADGVGPGETSSIDTLLREVVVPVVVSVGGAVVDGGTDSGVMRSLGLAVAAADRPVPLVGVTVASLVRSPEGSGEDTALEPHHTHVLLVDGTEWGDESEALAEVAHLLAAGAPTATLLVNGGEVSRSDVDHSLRLGRPVVAVAHSGRLADELAAARPDGVVVLEPGWPVDVQRRMLAGLLGAGSAG